MSSTLTDHKFIVFCVDHYNPLGMCRSLGEEGIRPIVILIGEHPVLINHCKYVKTLHMVKTPKDGLTLLINRYGNEPEKPFVLTGSDDLTELLDQHYDDLIDKFYFFNAGAKGMISYYMNKETICDLAQKCGLDKPNGEILHRGEVPASLKYPIITKVTMSIKGAWKKDVHICKDKQELIDVWPNIKANEILAQEYIVKKNELCVDGFSINGGAEVCFPNTSEYIRFTKDGYGNYMWIKPYEDAEVREKIKHIMRETNFSGIFSLECLIDQNDKLHFLEVNFRNSTWSYAYTFAGLNLPYHWAKATLEGHIDYSGIHLITKPFRAMAEINDFREAARKVGFMKWFWQFMTVDVHYTFNKKDMKPFFAELFAIVKRKISGR